MNIYSSLGSEVKILCPNGNVYPMLILLKCLAMNHEGTQKHCLKTHSGCLCCDGPWKVYADCSGRPRPEMLVDEIIWKIETAIAQYLDLNGNAGRVDAWEKEHKIKLYWNN